MCAVDAPDVVFGVSHAGRRAVCSGGSAPEPAVPRERLRFEIGSATKTFTGLLLAELVASGRVRAGDPAARLLLGGPAGGPSARTTLFHLATHTGGLPRLPPGFYRQALPAWRTNPYADHPARRVVEAFLAAEPRWEPGARWHYSNFGAAVLGHALAAAEGVPWEEAVRARVLEPLDSVDVRLAPQGPATDAVGHRRDGVTPVPPLLTAGFAPAGAVRAGVHGLLGYLEAHLPPERTAGDAVAPATDSLAAALREVRRPVLRRGRGGCEAHTLTWFRHDGAQGPMLFHAGATCGQQAFLGFCPEAGTAVVALSSRRFRRGDGLADAACALLGALR